MFTNIVPPSILGIRAPGCDIFFAKLSIWRRRGEKPESREDGFQALRVGGGRCIHRPGIAKHKKSPPGFPDGGFGWSALLAVGLAGPGPDQRVALAVLIVEQVGEDRRVEAGVIQFD